MLTSRAFHVITRTWPLWQWRYPWACLSDLNPYTAGSPRLINPCTTGSSSLFQKQPLPKKLTESWYAPWPPFYFSQYRELNWQRKFKWPLETIAGLWLVSQWETLSSSEKSNWDENWFWPAAGMDHFMWCNAARVYCKGQSSLLITPPPSISWIPLLSISYASTVVLPPATVSGNLRINTGSDFPDYSASDELWLLYCCRIRPSGRRLLGNCLYIMDNMPSVVLPQSSQPQTEGILFTATPLNPVFSTFQIQAHVFLRDGRHGCTEWFTCPCAF